MKWFNNYGREEYVTRKRCCSGRVTLDDLRKLVEDTEDWPGHLPLTSNIYDAKHVHNLEVVWREYGQG